MTGGFSSIIRGTLDVISDGIQIISREWRYLYINEAACRHGRRRRDELLGRTMMDCYPGIDETRMFRIISACMRDRTSRSLDNAFTYGDGSVGIFDLRVEPCPEGIFILSVDVTDRRRLEAELRQAQKMDAVGRLAGGVAHDFSNLLTAMDGFARFALDEVGTSHAAAKDMQEVLDAVDQASKLTRQLLAFSRENPVTARVVDVNGLVTALDRTLSRLVGDRIEIVTKLASRPCHALIDPGAFEQMVMNLVVNAGEAMPQAGAITIETSKVVVDVPRSASQGHVLPIGDYVVLSVTDQGMGIEAAILDKIFEPFFTTKPPGRGTGLGLATCYGIAKQAGGHIVADSEPGRGSTFKVYLPRARGPVAKRSAVPPPPKISGGHETILLVENDTQVRQVAERALASGGYDVLSACSGEEAIELLATAGRAPDLLLTDVTLPAGTGYDLAARLRARHPKLRVLYISGYTEASIPGLWGHSPGTLVLTKPFSATALARLTRQALDEEPPTEAQDVDQGRPLILIVDDDEILRRALKRQLSGLGCDVLEASDGAQAIRVACEASPAVIFIDLYMPGTDGHSLLRRLPISGVRSTAVVMSGDGNVDDVIAALRNGACDYLKKPWSQDDLASSLRRALDVFRVAEG